MTLPTNFVVTSADYSALRACASDVFHLNRGGLPEQVFADGFSQFCFLDFDLMLTPEYWEVFAACAEQCGDKEIYVMVHEPDPEAYYFSNFHRYGALRFERGASADDYYNALRTEPEDSPADALLYIANVISWWGSSKDWAFWGERDLGVGIAATRRLDLSWPLVEGIQWFDVESALYNLVALNFSEYTVPADFAAKLRSNYTGTHAED